MPRMKIIASPALRSKFRFGIWLFNPSMPEMPLSRSESPPTAVMAIGVFWTLEVRRSAVTTMSATPPFVASSVATVSVVCAIAIELDMASAVIDAPIANCTRILRCGSMPVPSSYHMLFLRCARALRAGAATVTERLILFKFIDEALYIDEVNALQRGPVAGSGAFGRTFCVPSAPCIARHASAVRASMVSLRPVTSFNAPRASDSFAVSAVHATCSSGRTSVSRFG